VFLSVVVALFPSVSAASDWTVETATDPMTDVRTIAASVEAVDMSSAPPGSRPKLMFLCQGRDFTMAIATGRPALMRIHKGRVRFDGDAAAPKEFAYAAGVFVPVVASPTYSIDRRFAEEAATRIVARSSTSFAVEIDGYTREIMVFRMPPAVSPLETVIAACRK